MIRYIEKIENLGVFSNYKRPSGMERFERFNLIYGLNGSGKTTLSRFLADLNEGSSTDFPELKYRIKADEGAFQQGQSYSRPIRVFNSEYVEANIGQLEGKSKDKSEDKFKGRLNPIYIIGEDNKALAESIEADEAKLSSLKEEYKQTKPKLPKLKEKRGELFSNVASRITKAVPGYVLRTYNKQRAEKAYDNLTSFKQLTVEKLAQITGEINQSDLGTINRLTPPTVKIDSNERSLFDALELLQNLALNLVQKSAISCAIERLIKNPRLARWVEQGRALHAENDDQKCEYCRQTIPAEREEELAAHFNQSDNDLKREIEDALLKAANIIDVINGLEDLSKRKLYPELQDEWSKNAEIIAEQQTKILDILDQIKGELEGKLARRTESYQVELTVPSSSDWDTAWSSINSLAQKHDTETNQYKERIDRNFKKIEEHYLSEIHTEVEEFSSKIKKLKNQIEIINDGNTENNELGITGLEARIRENRAKVSNSHQAAEELSLKLVSFLGRDDLKLESEEEGYRVTRFGRVAKRLSEGEKTAIAFLHFVVGLKDRDFNLEEGIVVIDDPISSLDSNSLYQAFSYLKESVKNAKQIFLLTHNFDFLKLLLDWFKHVPSEDKATYWMLHCSMTEADTREAAINPLDEVLRENKNEFAYLLKILKSFESDGTIANSYPIPNIMRKVLETFLEHHSSGRSLYKKLEKIDFDPTKRNIIYKFTNDQSHSTFSGLDPALVGETQTTINHLLEMIQKVAPLYYETLTEKINSKMSKK